MWLVEGGKGDACEERQGEAPKADRRVWQVLVVECIYGEGVQLMRSTCWLSRVEGLQSMCGICGRPMVTNRAEVFAKGDFQVAEAMESFAGCVSSVFRSPTSSCSAVGLARGLSPFAYDSRLASMADSSIHDRIRAAKEPDAPIVTIVDTILDELQQRHQAYRARIAPKNVGIHPANRDGYGVSESNVHLLGGGIVTMGWRWSETYNAVCVEDDSASTIAKFTEGIHRNAQGLGKSAAGEVRYGSLSCTHTNQFLVAVLCEVPTDVDNLQIDGRMSPAKLGTDPGLKKALTEGLEWLVLKADVPLIYPELCGLVQQAMNTPGMVAQQESEMQVLLRISALAAAESKSTGGVVNWERISDIVSRNGLRDPEDIACMMRFVQRWGGGDSAIFLQDLAAFHQVWAPANRIVGSATFKAIGDLRLSADEQIPYFAIGLVKVQVSAKKCLNRVGTFLSPSDIASCAANRKPNVLKGELIMKQFRATAKDAKLAPHLANRLYAKLDTTVVRFVLGKPCDIKYESLEGIVKEMGKVLAELSQTPGIADKLLEKSSLKRLSGEAAGSTVGNFMQYDTQGNAIAPKRLKLQQDGFREKMAVVGPDSRGEIATIGDDGTVDIRTATGMVSVVYEDFLKGWHCDKAPVVNIDLWQSKGPKMNDSYLQAVGQARVVAAMASLANDIGEPAVVVQSKPRRAVFADADYRKGHLVLVPVTPKTAVKKVGEKPPPGALLVTMPDMPNLAFYLLPQVSSTFVCPAWHLATTESEAESTVVLADKKVKVSVDMGADRADTFQLCLPIVVSRCSIKKGGEVLLYRAPVDVTAKPQRASSGINWRPLKGK